MGDVEDMDRFRKTPPEELGGRPEHPPDPPGALGDRPPGTEVTRYADKAMFGAEAVEEGAVERPRVYLLNATPDPLGAVAAFSMMYEGRVVRDLGELTDEDRKQYFDEAFKTALKSPLETIDLHFMVEGLTRASWDQMRTQRTAVFAGESLRFAVKDDITARPGPLIGQDEMASDVWQDTLESIWAAYQHLINNGFPAEEARGLLPMNVLTRGHWKSNLRNLESEIGKRLCTQAQFEWRQIHAELRSSIRNYGYGATADSKLYRCAGKKLPQRVGWQWEYIAESPMFQPICFQKGACMFKAKMDRGCTIRDRVDKGRFDLIDAAEWLADPKAGWSR